jgi:hypothetical protein
MTPEQLERNIADMYNLMGYETKLTPKSYDYGVDVIASNNDEKIAIQVKMYETRPVNYKDVMYLYAGKDYYDCDKGLMITTGSCDTLAIKVASKLGIEIQEHFVLKNTQTINKKKIIETYHNDFEDVWQKFIKPLKGQTILTGTGKKNIIIEVSDDFLRRQSSTGEVSKIEKQIFKTIFHRLIEKKTITRNEINTEYTKRGSAIITAVLGKVPFITLTEKPKITLSIKT